MSHYFFSCIFGSPIKKMKEKKYWDNLFQLFTLFGCEAGDKNMGNIILSIKIPYCAYFQTAHRINRLHVSKAVQQYRLPLLKHNVHRIAPTVRKYSSSTVATCASYQTDFTTLAINLSSPTVFVW